MKKPMGAAHQAALNVKYYAKELVGDMEEGDASAALFDLISFLPEVTEMMKKMTPYLGRDMSVRLKLATVHVAEAADIVTGRRKTPRSEE